MIYDSLFSGIFERQAEADTDVYRLPSEWPSCDYSSYVSLVSTCKQINAEAVLCFETSFLPAGIAIYGESVRRHHTLYNLLALSLSNSGSNLLLQRLAYVFEQKDVFVLEVQVYRRCRSPPQAKGGPRGCLPGECITKCCRRAR